MLCCLGESLVHFFKLNGPQEDLTPLVFASCNCVGPGQHLEARVGGRWFVPAPPACVMVLG